MKSQSMTNISSSQQLCHQILHGVNLLYPEPFLENLMKPNVPERERWDKKRECTKDDGDEALAVN